VTGTQCMCCRNISTYVLILRQPSIISLADYTHFCFRIIILARKRRASDNCRLEFSRLFFVQKKKKNKKKQRAKNIYVSFKVSISSLYNVMHNCSILIPSRISEDSVPDSKRSFNNESHKYHSFPTNLHTRHWRNQSCHHDS
jgi:hypothetical protein